MKIIRGRALALFFVLLAFGALIGTAGAGDEPFVGAANWGGTGLMESPTARVLFTGNDSRATYAQGLSPWTRDVAQDIEHFTSLFDVIGRNTDVYLKKDRGAR